MSCKRILKRKHTRHIREDMVSSSLPSYEGPKTYKGKSDKKIKPTYVKPYVEDKK